MAPLFSIVVPVYNLSTYVEATCNSLLLQTVESWECLLVDDGSVDASVVPLVNYIRKTARFRLICARHSGVSCTRNRALDWAKGKWIGFLDGDDVVSSTWLEHLLVAVEEQDIDFVSHNFFRWDGESLPIKGKVPNPLCWNIIREPKKVSGWLIENALLRGYIGTALFRREKITTIRFPLGVPKQEDTLFRLSAMPYIRGVCVTDIEDYYYRQRVDSAERKKLKADDALLVLRFITQLLDKNEEYIRVKELRRLFSCFLFNELVDVAYVGLNHVRRISSPFRREIISLLNKDVFFLRRGIYKSLFLLFVLGGCVFPIWLKVRISAMMNRRRK